MTRRLVVVMVALVVAALLLAGLGTLALARNGAEDALEGELAAQAEAIVAVAEVSNPRLAPADGEATFNERFAVLSAQLAEDGTGVLLVPATGAPVGAMPSGIELEDLDLGEVLAGRTQVGTVGDTVFAAASGQREAVSILVVVTRERGSVLARASRWFLLASGVTVLLAALVAVVLGRRLVRPVVQAAEATHRIADGDLSARLSAPPDRRGDELAELTRSVNAMAEALERSRGLEQQFLLSVSHDLRTPLTSIRGYAEAIQDGAVEPMQASETILAESRRLQRLVQDLLDLARLDARSFSLREESVDLRTTAVALVEALQAEATATDVRLEAVLPPTPDGTMVQADPDRLAQVVANLVENALRFARTQVRVEVVVPTHAGAPTVELSVHDDGEGIAAEDLPHVFERLYVATHRPERKEAGSGLGLAIARDLTRAMGGEITVDSHAGKGTTFSVVLPEAVSTPPSPE